MAGYVFCILITLVMPVLLTVVICVRIKTATPALLGALCFLVSQVFTRLPLLQYVLPKNAGYVIFQIKYPLCYILMLALSAGVFEECGRWFFMRAGRIESAVKGAVFGFCHGGVEAILFVGIPALRLLFSPPGEWSDATAHFPLAATERAFAIVAHVGLSLLVLAGVERRKKQLLLLAVLLHSLLDFSVVYSALAGMDGWLVEIIAAAYSTGILLLSSYVYVKRKGRDYK